MLATCVSYSRRERWLSGKQRQRRLRMLVRRAPSYLRNDQIHNHNRLRRTTCRDHSQVDAISALKFLRQHVDLFNAWWFRQQCARVFHQCFGNCSVEMCVASCVIRKSIEDAELGLSQTNGEPRSGSGFLLDQRESGTEKLFHLGFLT